MIEADVLAKQQIVYVTTVGRQSGALHRVEVWFAYQDGRIYLLAHRDAQWWRNLMANPNAMLEIGGLEFQGLARMADEKKVTAYSLFQEKYGKSQAERWYGGARSDRRTIEITLTRR